MVFSQEKNSFQTTITTSEEEIRQLKEEIQTAKNQLASLKEESSIHSDTQVKEIKRLQQQLDHTGESLRKAEEKAQTQLALLKQQEQESADQKELLQKQLSASEEEVKNLKMEIQTKEQQMRLFEDQSSKEAEQLHQEIKDLKKQVEGLDSSLKEAEEKLQVKENLFVEQQLQSSKDLEALQRQMGAFEDEVKRLTADISTKDEQLVQLRSETSAHSELLQQEIEALNVQIKTISNSLETAENQVKTKEDLMVKQEEENANQKELLQQQLHESTLQIEELRKHCDVSEDQVKQLKREIRAKEDIFVVEKEMLQAKILQAETDQEVLRKQFEALVTEKERLTHSNQAMEREIRASHKLESALQKELEVLKKESETAGGVEMKQGLEQQLAAKSEAVEHYKAQMEKAVSHYNSKKQLLQKSEEEVKELRQSLEVKEHETNALIMEKKLLKVDLDKVQNNEKKLLSMVASLEAQLAYADQTLRAQNKIQGSESNVTRPGVGTRSQLRKSRSSDSLDQSSLEDSLNVTRKLSAPDISSTPLLRSSQRLAQKRRGFEAESLETLYFTPLNSRQIKRSATSDSELDSAQKTPASSVKRRRMTQVINITMTKKMSGSCEEEDETFHSVTTLSSHQQPSCSRSVRPELSDRPVSTTGAAKDQLVGLPGYRRSTIHSQTTGTFCVGAENEPDGGPEDWLRIAELQSRNKACLPHLKSSYPVEFETGGSTAFMCTDEELRHGDPSDTIRRGSMIPGQLQDSLTSHRQSLMLGQAGVTTRSHRLSLMPGQLPAKRSGSCQQQSLKGKSSSSLSVHQKSPEKKTRVSCFPRPLTPKMRNVSSGPTISPANRRQSMMFTIDNTPKSNNNLKKKLNKLRGSSCKSPATRSGSYKSPQSAKKKSAKSPGLTASARKMMRRIKI
ncbi:nuclear mitotic apparatus protein 1 isoform X2 [Austrofundulus limnaeus]|uniref:Nuclear mitotic apparatus protein 1 isoform X2 n=1 Tax=Austrofundulus limnaeus TaxID=52670 RepID=A0A2I4B6V3_AUSLI|nr:PREDICTED: nuclear mitotic apparatus protein 1 isoform X2 [Austrofundulus limnaeus]